MDLITNNLPELIWALVLIAGAALVLSLARQLMGGGGRLPGIDRMLREGRYVQAAELALRHDRSAEAIDYFIRAQEPMRAAQVAAKAGSFKQAGELCERSGEWDRAARYFEQAGLRQRAADIRKAHGQAPVTDAATLLSLPPQGSQTGIAEEKFRKAKAGGSQTAMEKMKVQQLGREAADQALATGDLAGAAKLYRDADLTEEAVHLYVNVLGKPDEAAAILVELGRHERAAELLESAGQKERAAAVFAKLAMSDKSPEKHIERIMELHEPTGLGLLDELARARPLAKDTTELHYLHARALEKKGDVHRAMNILGAIEDEVGPFKDVSQRLSALENSPDGASYRSSIPGRRTSAPAPGEGSDDLANLSADIDFTGMGGAGRRSIIPGSGRNKNQTIIVQHVMVRGFEAEPIKVDMLLDSAVQGARSGPSIGALKKHLEDKVHSPQTIGLYYQLGLAYLAAGQYAEASIELGKVVEISPQYRDAYKRLEEINDWRKALAPNAHVGLPAALTGLRIILGVPEQQPVTAAPPEADKKKPDDGTKRPSAAAAAQVDSRYSIAGELGRGGMAVVYRATDTLLGRDVALKYLSEQFNTNEKVQEMFQREARAVAQLNHPNIVTIHDFGNLGGRTFIAMEYVEGLTVRQMCEEKKALSVRVSLRIILQLLSALEAAHARKIVHRDIKLSNMMRAPDGRVKLMDFGLAKSFEADSKASMVAGTPGYMAPEQLSGDEIDHRADLFAVGVSLYEMLAGRQPFKGILRNAPPKPVSAYAPNVPYLLDRVIQKSMIFDLKRRYQSAAAFAAPLRTILDATDRFGTDARAA